MYILTINTSSQQEVHVGIKTDEYADTLSSIQTKYSSQETLLLIEKLLKKHALSTFDLTAIEVHTGPGSFTGVRVGVSIANALSYALQIPVNGKQYDLDPSLVEPVYHK